LGNPSPFAETALRKGSLGRRSPELVRFRGGLFVVLSAQRQSVSCGGHSGCPLKRVSRDRAAHQP